MERKKLPAALAAVIAAVAVLLGGTLAWQSTGQRALNEASNVVNPGGRLHDDFDGRNKDVYVENFADEPIFVRLRLGEYLALTHNKGVAGAERENVLIGGADESGQRVCAPHIFGADNPSDGYWTWKTGGSTVYLPTFNKNKDSLVADVNGSYLGPDGTVTDRPDDDRYTDYTAYSVGQTVSGQAIYDADANDVDEVGDDLSNLANYVTAGSIVTVSETHTAKATRNAALISMADWLALTADGYDAEAHGDYWVYDADGWVYWAASVAPDSATGLLLDEIRLKTVMDDSWYYAIEVTAQFVTADDIGKTDHSGFYDPKGGTDPTPEAETLLERITGVKLK